MVSSLGSWEDAGLATNKDITGSMTDADKARSGTRFQKLKRFNMPMPPIRELNRG